MWTSDDRFHAIQRAELALLSGPTRHDGAALRDTLHVDFAEIGRSGRRWTRDEIIAALTIEGDGSTPHTDEWLFTEIAPHLVLVTYRLRTRDGVSRHSSIWDTTSGVPVLRFHQGTVVPATQPDTSV